jgi:hypothetical protein
LADGTAPEAAQQVLRQSGRGLDAAAADFAIKS